MCTAESWVYRRKLETSLGFVPYPTPGSLFTYSQFLLALLKILRNVWGTEPVNIGIFWVSEAKL